MLVLGITMVTTQLNSGVSADSYDDSLADLTQEIDQTKTAKTEEAGTGLFVFMGGALGLGGFAVVLLSLL